MVLVHPNIWWLPDDLSNPIYLLFARPMEINESLSEWFSWNEFRQYTVEFGDTRMNEAVRIVARFHGEFIEMMTDVESNSSDCEFMYDL